VAFLIPLFSVLWGVVFLGEPLTAGILSGLAIILLGEWLVLAHR
jgi:drug/metabolite transporter (DMT)-like permease